jgi:hypothetical protein
MEGEMNMSGAEVGLVYVIFVFCSMAKLVRDTKRITSFRAEGP